MPPVMIQVYSSNVRAVGHDPETNEMHVEWKSGKTSIYEGVSAEKAEDIRTSWSVGQAINTLVKDQHPHRYK